MIFTVFEYVCIKIFCQFTILSGRVTSGAALRQNGGCDPAQLHGKRRLTLAATCKSYSNLMLSADFALSE